MYKKEPRENPNKDKPFPFNERRWSLDFDIKEDDVNNIRVIQYNVLCDSLISISTQISEEELAKLPHLEWSTRKEKITKEILLLKGDVICFQEFERDEAWIEELGKNGYDVAFKARTGAHSEGCAIVWNNKKFTAENIYTLEFNINKGTKDVSDIYDRDNVCLFTILRYNFKPDTCFIVANGHLLFNTNRGDVKLAQSYQILKTFEILKAKLTSQYKQVNLIFCTDLNAIPNSGVYKLITQGSLDCTDIEKRKISGQNQGNLQSITKPSRLKPELIKYVTSTFLEASNKTNNNMDNETWFNNVLVVEPKFCEDTQEIKLQYKEKYNYQSQKLILYNNLIFHSAYSEMTRKIINYIKSPTDYKNIYPFDKIDPNVFNNFEINGIKMSYESIQDTLKYTQNLTLEPPMSYYGKAAMAMVDFIFYKGDLTVVRTLNIPDIHRVAFDQGYMPNHIYPSDHVCLVADFNLTI